MKTRQYKTGTKWCLWRWSGADSGFISRLHILQTPLFAICLHIFHKPDPEPWLHDHPVSFLSFVLKGQYLETRYRKGQTRQRLVRWVNWIRGSSEDRHTITACVPDTVSLAFMGPKTREWGYHTDRGWIYWRDYTHEKYRPMPEVARQIMDKHAVALQRLAAKDRHDRLGAFLTKHDEYLDGKRAYGDDRDAE